LKFSMDEISRKLLVAREAELESLVKSIAPTDEALAEFLSLMWFRALFGRNPTGVRQAASRELLRLADVDLSSMALPNTPADPASVEVGGASARKHAAARAGR
jgi:hypothetical protein